MTHIHTLLSHPRFKHIPMSEKELILGFVIHKPKEYVLAHKDKRLSIWKQIKVLSAYKKRSAGLPIAYLTGTKEFYGLDFLVNKHTLIPRPDTEILVEAVIHDIQTQKNTLPTLVVDIGTGTGCIPISILHAISPTHISTIAIDISKKSLRVAEQNAATHKTPITFLQGDLLTPLIEQDIFASYEHIIITANLPYLTEKQLKEEPSIQHEPRQALVADDEGLALYKKLLRHIAGEQKKYPIHSWSIYMEIDPEQTEHLSAYVKNLFQDGVIEIKKDLAGRNRMVHVTLNAL